MDGDMVRLRPTQARDLDFVLAAETAPDNAPYIGQWSRERHQAALGGVRDQEAHFLIEAGGRPIGYAILQGLDQPDQVRLRRWVITEKGRGYGRQALRLILQQAATYGSQRLWLDVKPDNHRAKALYRRAGFICTGYLQEPSATGNALMEVMAIHTDLGRRATHESI